MSDNVRKIFIIGNGFDLNLGYPTRFKDFLDFCSNWKKFYDNGEKFADVFNTNINDMKLITNKDGSQTNHWNEVEMSNLKIVCDDSEKLELNILDICIDNNGIIKYLIKKRNEIKYECGLILRIIYWNYVKYVRNMRDRY